MLQPWFTDAKLGIFIHWGLYSAGDWGESWPFFRGEVPHETYMAQAGQFTAANYDPEAWAQLFADAGAQYAVLTTKHHEGFALWDTKLSKLNAVEGSPAGRDLIQPYCDALRRHGLHVGLYFSHLDWSHPDYASILPRRHQPNEHNEMHGNAFGYPQNGERPEAWERFLAFHRGQLKELCERYHPELLWFDGDWERDGDQWRFDELREQLHAWAPGVVLNSRMGGYGGYPCYGDYGTPEMAIPVSAPADGSPWEFCVTINDSWGYRKADKKFKSIRHCVRMLAECAGMGGNLLLDVGPKADGTIIPEQEAVLRGLGRWAKKHGEALYGSVAGLPPGLFYGQSTLSKTRDTLYLIFFDRPTEPVNSIAVKGIRNKVKRTSVVGAGSGGGNLEVPHRILGGADWANLPGVLWVDLPDSALDPDATVVKVELEGPIDLYTGAGHAITLN